VALGLPDHPAVKDIQVLLEEWVDQDQEDLCKAATVETMVDPDK